MKSTVGGLSAQFLTTGSCVATMQNFNPLTLSFWATLIGIIAIGIIAGFVGEAIQKDFYKLVKKWHSGTRKQHLKHS